MSAADAAPPRDMGAVDTSRIVSWEGCLNVRDLGSLPTRDGRRIRWAALVRSAQPTDLTQAGQEAALAHGIRTVVDLRLGRELAKDVAYPLAGMRVHVPFDTGRAPDSAGAIHAGYAAARTRAEHVRLDLDWHQRGIAAAVAAIADAPEGGVLVHCAGGKDRTGVVVACVLACLGVADELIADDYALTMLEFEQLIADWLDTMTDDAAERDRLRLLAIPSREAMLEGLAHVRASYGSVERYLTGGGVTQVQLARLRARLLEPVVERDLTDFPS